MQASDMQEKKNKRLLVLLIASLACIAGAYWFSRQDRVLIDRRIFQVQDYGVINKVILESGVQQVELSFNGSRWRVNDQYDADRNLVSVLFATLKETVPKRPVAQSRQDSVEAILAKNGIQVSLFNGATLEKKFLAGGNFLKTQSWFKDLATGDVYVMSIPGYRVYVSGIFELSENQWRDKYVFGFNWRNFQSLEVSFPDKPGDNFKVAPQNNMFSVEGINTDTTRLGTYMDHVLSLTVNEYLNPGKYTDSLINSRPIMILTVTDIGKNQYTLRLFGESMSQVPGLIQEKQGAVFNRLKIQPILKPKSFFRVK